MKVKQIADLDDSPVTNLARTLQTVFRTRRTRHKSETNRRSREHWCRRRTGFRLPRMAYKIQYFRDGQHYAEVYWDAPLPDTRDTARRGLKRNRAQYATILDLEHGARPVETLSAH